MGKRIVVALGGNAILTDDPSAKGQIEALRYTSKRLIELIKEGHQLIISHGNGPQVGNLALQQAAADSKRESSPTFRYPCGDDSRKHRVLAPKSFE